MTSVLSFTSPLFRSSECFYRGRNGYGYCAGFYFSVQRRGEQTIVRLCPINSHRITDSCFLELPLAALPELISFLGEFHCAALYGLDSPAR